MPKGLRWYSVAHNFRELSDAALDTIVSFTTELPGPYTMAYLEPCGCAIGRVDAAATAFPHRDAAFGLHIFPGWTDPTDDGPLINWARRFHDAMAPHATGGADVNLLPGDGYQGVESGYGSNLERLTRVKAKWDPDNIFRVNHNIAPSFE
jgi:FAD/FMN-containing dehydrogenase